MTHNTIPMVELLSLEQSSNRYQMEIAITRSSGEANIDWFELDDFTYSQLSLLQVEGYRIRLSLYAKWDPYQRHYYSTIVRIKGSFQETLYFICSNTYIQQLSALRMRLSSVQVEEALTSAVDLDKVSAEENSAPAQQQAAGTARRNKLLRGRGLLWKASLISLLLLLAMMFRMQELLFIDRVDATDEHSSNSRSSHPSSVVEAAVSDSQHAVLTVGSANKALIEPLVTAAPKTNTANAAKSETKVQTKDAASKTNVQHNELKSDGYTYSLPKGYVALTFDDGPSAYTKQIVDILTDNDVAGTFLFIGKNAAKNRSAVGYAVEHGMSVGNHSWDHSKLTKLTDKAKLANITQTNDELVSDGAKQVTLFRPPYGLINSELAAQVKKQKMKVLMWNRDPEDWNADTRDEILDYFEKVNPSGGIYVLHEKKHTVEALPAIIEYLKKKQLKFVIFE
ncbi:peptidoglycan/xylan/chitin deacetylase (PgdA/CDA1 family) [Paenibacillus cellulosilyticus]|uniref:Peptidoglycan/xylan/chitin deacetylase (PgdA/CDA1 family) n=1 Tax=Paenibacillus cellulosilyticus TaxID=375489 RepID=A0A2V2Z0J2_9BACL|nr:polysaccharide deacetylase family protein [Paenibacillus cellulosilyticus]PWW08584.1 peptidoglycan/xylan/chitin deacetylase (PgdA/CDA1 family) [Paenibacillus cellulosilyticus]QKS48155.1 polysaccharide deacetylase family protein [Paenibacillus cellulosilyticus]